MRISDVLRNKGAQVATIAPDASVAELLHGLADHNIGAMVVVDVERDIVRNLHQHGSDVLQMPVRAIMTTLVATCGPDASVDDLTELMTNNRVRHIPVLAAGRLAGIVSIGDVVKTRMDELKTEQERLQAYIMQG